MYARKSLGPIAVRLDIPGTTKQEIIEAMVDLLSTTGKVRDRSRALSCVLERERKLSTGMKHGIAIPHGKTDAVEGMVAGLGVSREPIHFDSLDGLPCRIFIMTLSPPESDGPHLRFLSEVSVLLRRQDLRAKILDAKTPEDVTRILTGEP